MMVRLDQQAVHKEIEIFFRNFNVRVQKGVNEITFSEVEGRGYYLFVIAVCNC